MGSMIWYELEAAVRTPSRKQCTWTALTILIHGTVTQFRNCASSGWVVFRGEPYYMDYALSYNNGMWSVWARAVDGGRRYMLSIPAQEDIVFLPQGIGMAIGLYPLPRLP